MGGVTIVCPTIESPLIAPLIGQIKQSGNRKQGRRMAFKKINERMELSGFFNREQGQVIQGIVKKHIAKEDGPFYIFELTEPCKAVVDKKSKKVVTKVGDYVGVAASSSIGVGCVVSSL